MKTTKLRQSAKGQPCVNCGATCPTVCARHYNGLWQQAYGKGRGIKCHDLASAELCNNCEKPYAEGQVEMFDSSADRAARFLHLCMLTNIARFKRGDLTDGSKPKNDKYHDTTNEWLQKLGGKAA